MEHPSGNAEDLDTVSQKDMLDLYRMMSSQEGRLRRYAQNQDVK